MILGVLGLIWHFSSQPGPRSAALSEAVQQNMHRAGLAGFTPRLGLFTMQQAVRKWAHLYIYALLGLLTAAECRLLAPLSPFRAQRQHFIFPAAFCLAAAAFDEFHQLFVPGRSGEVRDVCVDFLGASAGICLVWAAAWLRQKFAKK